MEFAKTKEFEMTYVVKRPNKEPMYLQSFKVAKRIATDEAARGTVVGRILQDGSLGIIKATKA